MRDLTSTQQMKSRLLQTVYLRRGDRVLEGIATRSLVPGIKSGRLLPTDEFSGDGVHWIALGRHHQLSRLFTGHPEARSVESGPATGLFFDDVPGLPPGVEQQLDSLAGLLRDING